jgi:hypothetical protein
MSHELLHLLQSAGCPNVPVSCHSCDSLLHWIVAWQTTSSEPQFEHTGVERAARLVRSSTVRGTSGIKLNGLMSAARRILLHPFGLVFGPQPTPAITFRKITNCDVAHFVVDCRCAAGGETKKNPPERTAGLRRGDIAIGLCRQQTARADHTIPFRRPCQSGAPICSSKPVNLASGLLAESPYGSGSRFNPDRAHKD